MGMIPTIQINFTSGLPKRFPALGIYTLSDKKTGEDFIDNLIIYEYNLDKIKELWYNGDKEYDYIAILDLEKEDLKKACKGDKYMEAFRKEVEKLNEDKKFREFLSDEEDNEKVKNTLIAEAHENGLTKGLKQGLQEGLQEGQKQAITKIVKNMLKLGIDPETISKATGLSEQEIKNKK